MDQLIPQNMNEMAAMLHEYYLSLVQAGFSEEQAMRIILALVGRTADGLR